MVCVVYMHMLCSSIPYIVFLSHSRCHIPYTDCHNVGIAFLAGRAPQVVSLHMPCSTHTLFLLASLHCFIMQCCGDMPSVCPCVQTGSVTQLLWVIHYILWLWQLHVLPFVVTLAALPASQYINNLWHMYFVLHITSLLQIFQYSIVSNLSLTISPFTLVTNDERGRCTTLCLFLDPISSWFFF